MPFAKGKEKTSGRKKGVPNKATADIKAALREHGPALVKALIALTKDKDPRIQLGAIQTALDRAYGKPAQTLAVGGDEDAPAIQHDHMIEKAHYDQLIGKLPPARDPPEEDDD